MRIIHQKQLNFYSVRPKSNDSATVTKQKKTIYINKLHKVTICPIKKIDFGTTAVNRCYGNIVIKKSLN